MVAFKYFLVKLIDMIDFYQSHAPRDFKKITVLNKM